MLKRFATLLCGTVAVGLLSVGGLAAGSGPASADPVAEFYKGKQLRLVVRTTTGGDYDQYSRLIGRYMGKYIPGNPSIIVLNMPGGGGIIAANYMANIAPKDGTVFGIVSQGIPLDQALGMSPQLQADMRTFNWIANVVQSNQLLVVWHSSQTKTFEDAKKRETLIGTTGAGSASVQYPSFYNNVLGTRFKMVTGYISGQDIDLAMERGEVDGRGTNPYSGYMASKPTWIPEGKIIPLMQAGVVKEAALPNVPLIIDQPVPPGDRPLLEMMARASSVGRPLATTPGVPAERVAALRAAFIAMMADPEFKATAAKESLEIRPMSGEELAGLIAGILDASLEVRDRVKLALQPKSGQIGDKAGK